MDFQGEGSMQKKKMENSRGVIIKSIGNQGGQIDILNMGKYNLFLEKPIIRYGMAILRRAYSAI